MAGYCVTFLFYSYIAATIVYLIFGIFASTGNAALLIEHYRINSTNQEIEDGDEKDVKSRTIGQYFFGSCLTLIISILLYIFCMRSKEEIKEPFSQTISMDVHAENNILNQPENANPVPGLELTQPNDEIITQPNEEIKTINTVGSIDSAKGMSEKEI